MPETSSTPHGHTHHHHSMTDGTHVMPDGTVMKGSMHEHHDHSAHANHDAHSSAAAKPAPKGDQSQVEYTCPMHPQVRQMGPGNCPICGMALEPVLATTEQGESPELRDMTRRFWIGTALTVPVFALEMGGHLTNLNHLLGQQLSNWIQLLLGTPVVLWAGWPFFVRAVASVPCSAALDRPMPSAPDCATSATRLPGIRSPRENSAKAACRPRALQATPTQLGPTTRIPQRAASSTMRACAAAPSADSVSA